MYHFVNRRGDKKVLIPFYTDDSVVTRTFGERNTIEDLGFLAAPIQTGVLPIETNKKVDHGYGRDQVLMFFSGKSIVGPWRIDTNKHYVITPNAGKLALVSVEDALSALDARLLGHALDVQAEAASENVGGIILEYAGALLSGLAWGMSGAVPLAGLALYPMGTIVSVAFSTSEAALPDPPSLRDIEGAVRSVITEALDQSTAERAGELFVQNVEWFLETGKTIESYAAGSAAPPAPLLTKFKTLVGNALDPSNSHSFISTLNYVAGDPDISKRILPEYVAAVGLALHLKRIDLAMTYLPDRLDPGVAPQQIPANELMALLQFAKDHRVALRAAMDGLIQYRRQLIAGTGLQGTPEAVFALRHISQHFTDQPDAVPDEQYRATFPSGCDYLPGGVSYGTGADSVTKNLSTLDEIIGFLQADVDSQKLGNWPNHLFTLGTT